MNHHHVQKLQLVWAAALKGHFCNSRHLMHWSKFHLDQCITELLSSWIYPQVQSELRGLNTWFREQIWTNVSRYLGKKLQYNMSPICHVWHLRTVIFFVFADCQWKDIVNSILRTDTSLKDSYQLAKPSSVVAYICFFSFVNYHSCHYEPHIPKQGLLLKSTSIHALSLSSF